MVSREGESATGRAELTRQGTVQDTRSWIRKAVFFSLKELLAIKHARTGCFWIEEEVAKQEFEGGRKMRKASALSGEFLISRH